MRMAKKKTRRDTAEIARSVVEQAIGEPLTPDSSGDTESKESESDNDVVGRKGGIKGGRARAEKLTFKRRREIAEKAAKARWSKRQSP